MTARKKESIFKSQLAVCLGISLLAGIVTCLLASSSFIQNLELKMLNTQFRLRGPRAGSSDVLVAEIDETMVQRLGYPVPRKYHAMLMQVLNKAGITAIGFDIFFDATSPLPEQDTLLATLAAAVGHARFPATFPVADDRDTLEAVRAEHAALIGPLGYRIGRETLSSGVDLQKSGGDVGFPFYLLLEGLKNLAQVNIYSDPDGFHRRVPLFIDYGGVLYPNLGLQLAMDHLGVMPESLAFEGRYLVLKSGGVQRRIPMDPKGNMLINFDGLGWDKKAEPADRTGFEYYSTLGILQEYRKKSDIYRGFKDRVVVVGQSATAVGDLGPTPFDNKTALHYLHANAISNIINNRFLDRAPGYVRFAILMVLCLLTGLVLGRFKTKIAIPLIAVFLAVYGAATLVLFAGGTWFDTATPVIGVMLTYLGCFLWVYIVVEKDERFVKEMFGKYQSEEVLEKMKEKDLDAAGERKEMTLLFSDVKSFSKISDQVELTELVLQLKEYFDEMTRIIFKYDGYLDKFMGDGIMAFFNDPKERPDHVLCGVKAAWEMQQSMIKLREKWGREGKTQFQIRIGLNTGIATVGNLGSTQKFTYTAFGSTVNVASRMESSGRPDGVQVTGRVYEATKDYIEYEDAGEIMVKNIVKPVKVYFVKGLKNA